MLNPLQKHLLEATFSFVFDTLKEDVSIEVALKTLKAMQDEAAFQAHQELFATHDLLPMIQQIRAIYAHPYPQNRSTGSISIDRLGFVGWRASNGSFQVERQGLLSLTAQTDGRTPPPTKQDVTDYLDSQIELCRGELQARQATEQTIARVRQPVPPFAKLFAYIQATVSFYDALSQELRKYPKLDSQAAATYMTTVLNVIRKNSLEAFCQDSRLFAFPTQLLDFIRQYLMQHPILLEAKHYFQETKELEKQYLLQGCANLASFSHGDNAYVFFAPVTTTQSMPIADNLRQMVCGMVEDLQAVLSTTQLDAMSAQSYVANILAAIRKNNLNALLTQPQLFGIPDELKTAIQELLQRYPAISQVQHASQELKRLEVALATQWLTELRDEQVTQSTELSL